MRDRNDSGFTLLEMVWTLAILGILLSIAIPMYGQYRLKAERVAAAVEARQQATEDEWNRLNGEAVGTEPHLDPNDPDDAEIPVGAALPPSVLSCPGKVTGPIGKLKCHPADHSHPYYL